MAAKERGAGEKYLLMVLVLVGFLWLRSSWGKIAGGTFVSGLAKTLTNFASKNPYPWFKDFLETVAIPNSQTFGLLVLVGEMTAAMLIFVMSLYLLAGQKTSKLGAFLLPAGLLIAAALNLTFWLASGWMSASGDSLNLLMLGVETVGLVWATKGLLQNR
ncbi:MAG: hypothetical protein UY21_C0022G0018 [Microgenomates group bacterium GW2011_GWA1_48_10]|uniref:DoxX family protein n=1 Tax=Candidatus Gottesmanbacteria bacterium RIFCSPHIGHO2_01_FULL_47_48 TaxID=1798381 RepID=A0A1F6A197_9BACT|nr:MAG: hypothetical protein UY21_C0022G0018 [Microgenomates group bacterium GW2011_GWA1_48_10]OGG18451.1 MAG: hypothetical protein A2721_01540 [Candidatus Gottesmanbacteria bacterium RIFCSPHIGHO2_01_FULL_47_48]